MMQSATGSTGGSSRRLVRTLGAASLGLGVPMLTDPAGVARVVGIDDDPDAPALIGAVGLRELLAGALLLVGPPGSVWTRIAGDAMDLTVLGRAMGRHRGRPVAGQLDTGPSVKAGFLAGTKLPGTKLAGTKLAGTKLAGRRSGGPGGVRRTRGTEVALGRDSDRLGRATLAAAAVAGLAAVDGYAALRSGGKRGQEKPAQQSHGQHSRGQQHDRGKPGPLELQATITVNKDPDETYAYWRDFTNLPSFMLHLRSVTPTGSGDQRSRWEANAPLGRTVTWDAELTGDEPGRRISWRSLPGSRIPNAGTVHFAAAPGDRGTEVKVVLHYDIPGGRVGRIAAKLVGEEPEQQVRDDLRRFKQVLETGDIVRSDGLPYGTDARHQAAQRPGQPVPSDFDIDIDNARSSS